MDLQPIKMTRFEARETLQQYRAILKEKRSKEDIAIMRSAKAIMGGQQVIKLTDTIHAGGYDAESFPRLAVARADDPWVACVRHGINVRMCGIARENEWLETWGNAMASIERRAKQANPRAFYLHAAPGIVNEKRANAIVPSIPPQHRPDGALERFYVLFEANWKPVPPLDPALLSPLGGGMFAVVAVWDLTELERAVLGTQRGI